MLRTTVLRLQGCRALVLILNDFVSDCRVEEAPHANPLFVDGPAVAWGRVHDFQQILIFKEVLQTTFE